MGKPVRPIDKPTSKKWNLPVEPLAQFPQGERKLRFDKLPLPIILQIVGVFVGLDRAIVIDQPPANSPLVSL